MFDLGMLQQLPATVAGRSLPPGAAGLVEEIGLLEDAVNALRARQVRLAAALVQVREAERPPRRTLSRDEQLTRLSRLRASVGAEVGLARRVSPHQGRAFVSLALVLPVELPATWAACQAGRLPLERARMVASGTAMLSLEQRQTIDAAVCGDPDHAARLGDRELGSLVRGHAARLDPAGVVAQIRHAEGGRRVTLRPGRDHLVHLHAALPIRDGVACLAALKAAATSAVAAGETGSADAESTVMADLLVARLTGRDASTNGLPEPVQLRLVVAADDLFRAPGDEADGTATLVDPSGTIQADGLPAELARRWIRSALDAGQKVAVKRLFAHPDTGALVAMDSRSRTFPPGLAELITLRDRWCRTPYCNAPIRQIDHVRRHADGGPTSYANAQGLCITCNQVKEEPGWHHEPPEPRAPGAPHAIRITTPTGSQHRARARPLLTGLRPVRLHEHPTGLVDGDPRDVAAEIRAVEHRRQRAGGPPAPPPLPQIGAQ
ncbi:DUF222 domain-containing protein [Nocardioides sp. TRM66260-LWL]|uniref:HNH endonuclease n=1 Tax=Nocardioides sp. TRM66260-LWL TaxID=2874478 RepID=UPI001CC79037|nr:DUF222 domain-containing protein [Nocardioides sp. TRM66260-LWL]MBZ5734766.1 DUF222 domain-containing protein [Nocardioides sp. TRM66260-LWL]